MSQWNNFYLVLILALSNRWEKLHLRHARFAGWAESTQRLEVRIARGSKSLYRRTVHSSVLDGYAENERKHRREDLWVYENMERKSSKCKIFIWYTVMCRPGGTEMQQNNECIRLLFTEKQTVHWFDLWLFCQHWNKEHLQKIKGSIYK